MNCYYVNRAAYLVCPHHLPICPYLPVVCPQTKYHIVHDRGHTAVCPLSRSESGSFWMLPSSAQVMSATLRNLGT
eukprot:COSAG06_NODE_238_length_19422_cov_16.417741_21_plen_75_part_00